MIRIKVKRGWQREREKDIKHEEEEEEEKDNSHIYKNSNVVLEDPQLMPEVFLLVTVRSLKVHAGTQPKRVAVQHRLVLAKERAPGAVHSVIDIACLQSRCAGQTHPVLVGWHGGSVEVVNIGTGVVPVFRRIGVVEHIGLGVVLLFCDCIRNSPSNKKIK